MESTTPRPVAVVTGAGRRQGIAAAIVERLAADGFDVAFSSWRPYDERMDWGPDDGTADALVAAVRGAGGRAVAVEVDFEDAAAPVRLFDRAEDELGPVQVLVVAHCESVDMTILDATVEGFDRHMVVNARATWLLVREFAPVPIAARFRADRRADERPHCRSTSPTAPPRVRWTASCSPPPASSPISGSPPTW